VDTGVASSIKAAASHLEQLGSLVEEVCCSLSKNNKYFFVFVYSRSLKKKSGFFNLLLYFRFRCSHSLLAYLHITY
jgi:hypothetical protein